VLHVADRTGQEIGRGAGARVRATSAIHVYEDHHAIDLLVDEKFGLALGRAQCWGAYVLDAASGDVVTFTARRRCSRPAAQARSTSTRRIPTSRRGTGIALAFRAGLPRRRPRVHAVPSDLPVSPEGEVVPRHRSDARRRRV
jgi:L-aspartate oxidase